MSVWLEMSTWAATRSSVGSLYIVHHGPRSMASRGWAGWKFAAAPITGPVVSLNSDTGGPGGGGRLVVGPAMHADHATAGVPGTGRQGYPMPPPRPLPLPLVSHRRGPALRA